MRKKYFFAVAVDTGRIGRVQGPLGSRPGLELERPGRVLHRERVAVRDCSSPSGHCPARKTTRLRDREDSFRAHRRKGEVVMVMVQSWSWSWQRQRHVSQYTVLPDWTILGSIYQRYFSFKK